MLSLPLRIPGHTSPSSQSAVKVRPTYPGGPQPRLQWSEESLGGGQHSFSARTRAWHCHGMKCSSGESGDQGTPHPLSREGRGLVTSSRRADAESGPATGSQEIHTGPPMSGAWNTRPGSPVLPPRLWLHHRGSFGYSVVPGKPHMFMVSSRRAGRGPAHLHTEHAADASISAFLSVSPSLQLASLARRAQEVCPLTSPIGRTLLVRPFLMPNRSHPEPAHQQRQGPCL